MGQRENCGIVRIANADLLVMFACASLCTVHCVCVFVLHSPKCLLIAPQMHDEARNTNFRLIAKVYYV